MKYIRPLVFSFALLLAVGAFAIQSSTTPSGQSSAPQEPAQQNPPAQQQPPAQPSQPPAAQQPAEPQPSQPMRPPSIDEQVKTLAQELTLNPEQQGKVKTI